MKRDKGRALLTIAEQEILYDIVYNDIFSMYRFFYRKIDLIMCLITPIPSSDASRTCADCWRSDAPFDALGPFECSVRSACLGNNSCLVVEGELAMDGPLCGSCSKGSLEKLLKSWGFGRFFWIDVDRLEMDGNGRPEMRLSSGGY